MILVFRYCFVGVNRSVIFQCLAGMCSLMYVVCCAHKTIGTMGDVNILSDLASVMFSDISTHLYCTRSVTVCVPAGFLVFEWCL